MEDEKMAAIEAKTRKKQVCDRPIDRRMWNDYEDGCFESFHRCLLWEDEEVAKAVTSVIASATRDGQHEWNAADVIALMKRSLKSFHSKSSLSDPKKQLVEMAVKLHYSMILHVTPHDEWMWTE